MKKLFNLCYLISLTIAAASCKDKNAQENTNKPDATTSITILTGGLSNVWDMVIGPDDKLWFTERGGKVSQLDLASKNVKEVIRIGEVDERGEGGLLGLALHPDFTTTPEVFMVYNYNNNGSYKEKVVKYTYNGTTLVKPVKLIDNISAASFHNGSRLLISEDRKLFITTGDAGDQRSSQNVESVNGKILRINLDGSIPTDNPFPNNPVWSFGHRNAQGLVIANGKMYSSEHGPNTNDEINIIEKQRNYGWPNVEGKCDLPDEQAFCTSNNIAEPIYTWTPTIAVCGLDYYNNDLIPQWKNSLILATLKGSTLYQLKLNSTGTAIASVKELVSGTYGRLREVLVGADGKIYFSSSNGSDDKILVITAD